MKKPEKPITEEIDLLLSVTEAMGIRWTAGQPWTIDAALPEMKRWVEAEPREWSWTVYRDNDPKTRGFAVIIETHPMKSIGMSLFGTEAIAFARAILEAVRKEQP